MNMKQSNRNLTTKILLLKNLPRNVEMLTDIFSQLHPLPAEIKPFGRRRALLSYTNENEATMGLQQLQGITVQGIEITASFFFKDAAKENAKHKPSARASKVTKTTQTNANMSLATMPALSSYVRQLYACSDSLDFRQPPPPYLRYAYPRITPAILDSISIALMSNTRFYTQVLHLMNRMNLEPPFSATAQKYTPPGEPREMSTQTEAVTVTAIDAIELPALPKPSTLVETSEESELESSADEQEAKRKKDATASIAKRKQPQAVGDNKEKYKKKARLLLQATLLQKQTATKTISNIAAGSAKPLQLPTGNVPAIFDVSASLRVPKIAVNIRKTKQPALVVEPTPAAAFVPPMDLGTQRLSMEQQQQLPIYKNYTQGEPSNKLYLKNLAKDVSADDLLALYARFARADELEVKVMQQGRMKGQAFVTFSNLTETAQDTVVGMALRETNGFLLKQKPMVVCYGRK